jgi:hypothetical protein
MVSIPDEQLVALPVIVSFWPVQATFTEGSQATWTHGLPPQGTQHFASTESDWPQVFTA